MWNSIKKHPYLIGWLAASTMFSVASGLENSPTSGLVLMGVCVVIGVLFTASWNEV